MSIHVTVSGNRLHRERPIFADREQIKKQERERRKRLRIEQVRQQSRNISSDILERSKQLVRKELNQLEKNENSELKRLHERKISEMQQVYQDNMEDIGLAHEAAQAHPNVDVLLHTEKERNQVVTTERGKEAMQKLRKKSSKPTPAHVKRERLRQVREIEDIRSAMVANISKQPYSYVQEINLSQDTDTPSTIDQQDVPYLSEKSSSDPDAIKPYVSPKKKIRKPVEEEVLGRIKVRTNDKKITQKFKGPQRVVADVHQEDVPSNYSEVQSSEYHQNVVNVDAHSENNRIIYSADNQFTSNNELDKVKNGKFNVLTIKQDGQYLEYNPNDYRPQPSGRLVNSGSNSNSTSSSVSDDLSYVSDNVVTVVPHNSPIKQLKPCPTVSKIKHKSKSSSKTKKTIKPKRDYSQDFVERIDIRSDINAEDKARLITEEELIQKNLSNDNKHVHNQKLRCDQALLRERIRQKYTNLIKNLDHLTSEERKLRASNIKESKCRQRDFADHSRRKEIRDVQQKMMEDAYNSVVYDDDKLLEIPNRLITLPRQQKEKAHKLSEKGKWQNPYLVEKKMVDQQNELSREEQFLELLKRIERLKKLLLEEYQDKLPDEIFNASVTPLFKETRQLEQETVSCTLKSPVDHTQSPEIKVINISQSDDKNRKPKEIRKVEKKKKPDSSLSDKSKITMQTSQVNEDKGVQVELNNTIKHITIPRASQDSKKEEYVEPIVTIVTHGEVSSNESFAGRGIIINVGNSAIQRINKQEQQDKDPRKSSSHAKARSLPSNSPVKGVSTNIVTSTSAPSSRATSPAKVYESTDSTDSQTTANKVINRKLIKSSPRKLKKKSPVSSARYTGRDDRYHAVSHAPDIQQASTSSGITHCEHQHRISYTDNSEASSSYASLSAFKATTSGTSGDNLSAILQLLNSPLKDNFSRLARDISPATTPETPSSHIMNVPSNIPRLNRIAQILNYDDDKMTKTQKEFIRHSKRQAHEEQDSTDTRDSMNRRDETACSCKNSICHIISSNVGELIQRKHSLTQQDTETMAKFDNLQEICQQRIRSLTTLLDTIRNDKDIEQSVISQTTQESVKLISPAGQQDSVLNYYKRLYNKTETIYDHLLKTYSDYSEYKKINEDHKVIENLSPISGTHDNQARQSPIQQNIPDPSISKAKPKIISDQRTNIDLRRYGIHRETQIRAPTEPLKNDNLVEKFTNEILEQSKITERNQMLGDTSFGDETIHQELPKMRAKNIPSLKTSSPKYSEATSDVKSVNKKRMPQSADSVSNTPNVPKINGVYNRVEGSTKLRSGLSVIDEQDTPDTAGRSLASMKSSSTKSQQVPTDSLPKHIVFNNLVNNQNNNISIFSNVGKSISNKQASEQKIHEEMNQIIQVQKSDQINGSITCHIDKNHADSEHGNQNQLLTLSTKNIYDIHGEKLIIDESVKSLDSFLIQCSSRNLEIKSDKITSSSNSSSFSKFSGISDILTTPNSVDTIASPPEKMEDYLMGLGLAWLIPIARKTREASALSSSSSSDITIAVAKRTKSPIKKTHNNSNNNITSSLLGISDMSSISIREANKSTEKNVLMKGRTSTPNISNFHYTSEKSSLVTSSTSGGLSIADRNDSIITANLSLYLKT